MFFILPLRDNAPSPAVPWATLALIALNVLGYLVQLGAPGGPLAVIDAWGIQPQRLSLGQPVPGTPVPSWVTLWASTYLHFDLLHLAGNMVMLWLFGDALEWLCGRARYIVFYTLCGVIASIATWVLGGSSTLSAAGASGALAGVMGAYLLTYPWARITCFVWFPPFIWTPVLRNVSSFWFIGLWLVQQLLYAFAITRLLEPGPFGVYAHLAGALAGMALIGVAKLHERSVLASHPAHERRLSLPLVGDAGDGGDGRPVDALRDPRYLAAQRAQAMNLPFDDRAVRTLLEQGDLTGAHALCELMLAQAQADHNNRREDGYRALLDEVREHEKARGAF